MNQSTEMAIISTNCFFKYVTNFVNVFWNNKQVVLLVNLLTALVSVSFIGCNINNTSHYIYLGSM